PSVTCPADAKSTVICRVAAGVCDIAESCNGASNDCPADAFKPATTACRAATGACDIADSCTGSGPSCPVDAKKANGVGCSEDGNPCTTDLCDGSSNDCQHAPGNPGAVCRTAAGECDVPESCTGSSA